MALADRIAIVNNGVILQVGPPQDPYHRPVDTTVAEFFGSMNWLHGSVMEAGILQTEIGTLLADVRATVGSPVVIGVRTEDVHLSSSPSLNVNEFEGEIFSCTFLGEHNLYHLQTRTKRLVAKATGTTIFHGKVWFRIPKDKVTIFPKAIQHRSTMEGTKVRATEKVDYKAEGKAPLKRRRSLHGRRAIGSEFAISVRESGPWPPTRLSRMGDIILATMARGEITAEEGPIQGPEGPRSTPGSPLHQWANMAGVVISSSAALALARSQIPVLPQITKQSTFCSFII